MTSGIRRVRPSDRSMPRSPAAPAACFSTTAAPGRPPASSTAAGSTASSSPPSQPARGQRPLLRVFGTSNGNSRLDCWESGNSAGPISSSAAISHPSGSRNYQRLLQLRPEPRRRLRHRGQHRACESEHFSEDRGQLATVFSSAFPLPDGPYMRSVYSVDLRDDRRIYFIAMDNTSRMVLYEATPRF